MKQLSSPVSSKNGQQGFTLVELMIALVVGLMIVLGAVQFYLTGFHSFRQVEVLGKKQAALTYAADALVRDIRRASLNVDDRPSIEFSENNILEIRFPNDNDIEGCDGNNDLVYRVYRLSESIVEGEGYSLRMGQDCQPSGETLSTNDLVYHHLVAGFEADGFSYDGENSTPAEGVWQIKFNLRSERGASDEIHFYAVNRTSVIIGSE